MFVAYELKVIASLRTWRDEWGLRPHSVANLFIAYYASAEIGCHRRVGLAEAEPYRRLPTAFRCDTNGVFVRAVGLLECLPITGSTAWTRG